MARMSVFNGTVAGLPLLTTFRKNGFEGGGVERAVKPGFQSIHLGGINFITGPFRQGAETSDRQALEQFGGFYPLAFLLA
jgi:hypothetical protein